MQDERPPLIQNGSTHTISGVQELVLNEQDLKQLGLMTSNRTFGPIVLNGTDCQIEGWVYNQTVYLNNYSTWCTYTINSVKDTEVTIHYIGKITNPEDLNGTYQYNSGHYVSSKGIISENDFGDQSKFHVNSDEDYGAEFNKPGIYYYHLWFTKDGYLIEISNNGTKEGNKTKEYIAKIGRQILSKFG
ncbi:MAG TPA: hypothetical protein VJJ52_03245 [Candidatus Nanoarchaeia archaeon]|nr:hypothetical protein [Candidatus Nanoarchaeia archaeon]